MDLKFFLGYFDRVECGDDDLFIVCICFLSWEENVSLMKDFLLIMVVEEMLRTHRSLKFYPWVDLDF